MHFYIRYIHVQFISVERYVLFIFNLSKQHARFYFIFSHPFDQYQNNSRCELIKIIFLAKNMDEKYATQVQVYEELPIFNIDQRICLARNITT